MPNELVIIEGLLHEHAAIRGHMHTVCSLMGTWNENLPTPAKQAIEERALSEKGLNLRQTMNYLDEGLKQHHKREEEALLPIAGEPIVEALKIEHREMIHQMTEINFVLRDTQPEALIANFDYLKAIIDNLCNLVSFHSSVEDTLLSLLKKRYI